MATQSRHELQTRHVGPPSYDPACTADLTPKDHSTQTIFKTEVNTSHLLQLVYWKLPIISPPGYKPPSSLKLNEFDLSCFKALGLVITN